MVKVTKSYTRQSNLTPWFNSTAQADTHFTYMSNNHNRTASFQDSVNGLVRTYTIIYPDFDAYVNFINDDTIQNGISARKLYNYNNGISESFATKETI
jgi:hypothetical protein